MLSLTDLPDASASVNGDRFPIAGVWTVLGWQTAVGRTCCALAVRTCWPCVPHDFAGRVEVAIDSALNNNLESMGCRHAVRYFSARTMCGTRSTTCRPALQLVDGIGGHALLCTRNVCNARWSSPPPPCGCRIHRPWSDVDSRAACVGRQSVKYAFPARPRVRSWSWLRRPRTCLCRGKGRAGAGAIWLRSSGDDAGHSGSVPSWISLASRRA